MKSPLIAACLCACLAGCASVSMNDGTQVVIEHEWPQTGQSMLPWAVTECKKAGRQTAAVVRTTTKVPGMFSFLAPDVTTYRCE